MRVRGRLEVALLPRIEVEVKGNGRKERPSRLGLIDAVWKDMVHREVRENLTFGW